MSGPAEEELAALLQLRLLPGVGDRAAQRLLARFDDARSVLAATRSEYAAVMGQAAAETREGSRTATREGARRALDEARRSGSVVVGRGLAGYPGVLLKLADPPPVLFLRGRLELLAATSVTVVGSRRATGAGRRFAYDLGRTLSHHGVPVASGLALGVDGAAHKGALEGSASTIAVLGTGIDRAHPRSHARLQARIGEEGLLVSEFLPGEEVRPHHFPRRNRILAALGHAVVVVEAGARSGALITVDHALDIGHDVYAVPGPVEYEQSRGTNRLLQDGARMVTDPEDLLRYWVVEGVRFPGEHEVRRRMKGESGPPPGTPDPDGLLAGMGARPEPADHLARRLGLSPARLLQALSELELLGAVVREPDGWRAANPQDVPAPRRRQIRMKQLWIPEEPR